MDDLILRQAAIVALRNMAVPLSKDPGCEDIWERDRTLDNAIDVIRELPSAQPEQRWIPVSERLPNCNGCYLVWRPHFFGGKIGMPSICYFDGKDTWHDSYGVDFSRILQPSDVTAWMPLPEPYKGSEQDGKVHY